MSDSTKGNEGCGEEIVTDGRETKKKKIEES